MKNILFDKLDDVIYPYVTSVRNYLEAGADADVNNFDYLVSHQSKPVTVSWRIEGKIPKELKLEIATKYDYSDAIIIYIPGNKNSYDLKHLYRDTQYYVRLSSPKYCKKNYETTFKTAYLGPRFLDDVGGLLNNCRDIGGYKVKDKIVNYNMIIRGSSPDNCSDASSETLTEEGKTYLTNEIKIKTQLDLRRSPENCNRTFSSFKNANYIQVPLCDYAQCFLDSQAELYKKAFSIFADKSNYPIYIHCMGGADRTGTVIAILLAYLGVSKEEVIQDYVLTTFSPVASARLVRAAPAILNVLNGFEKYEGKTLSEKVRSYLVSIGLTDRELFNIKDILLSTCENESISFDPIDEIVYPYIDSVRDYLEAGGDADVNNYDYHVVLQLKPITISWNVSGLLPSQYDLELATKSDYSDRKVIKIPGKEKSYELRNLLRDTSYFVRISVSENKKIFCETSFKTTYLGPRFLDVGGLYQNCRDLGGYKVNGKTILYNKIIRGSSPDNCSSATSFTLTEEGKNLLDNEIRIKTQLDFRGSAENCNRTCSSFENANYIHVPLSAYTQCFADSQASLYREAFSVFAKKSNYPIYIHCVGGADRTGTVAAILLAYLGVNKDEIIQDYVVTTFSPVCASQNARSRDVILNVLDGLSVFNGNTLSEQARSYLISIGLTQKQLFNIKAIMFGENLSGYIPMKDYGIIAKNRFYKTNSEEDFEITLNGNIKVKNVLIDEIPSKFSQKNKKIIIKKSVLSPFPDGRHKLSVIFIDGGSNSISFSINFVDLSGDLQATSLIKNEEQTVVTIKTSSPVFNGIEYHFHTRRSTLFPDVEPYIKINGESIADLNDSVDLFQCKWTKYPGSVDARHRVPVTISASGDTLKLVFRTEWLESYLNGWDLKITFCSGFNYMINDESYKVLTDVTYIYYHGIWVKIV